MQPGVLNKITDDRPEMARAILAQRHEPREAPEHKSTLRDIPRFILDPIDSLNEHDPEYRLFALSHKGKGTDSILTMQFTRSKARIKRNVDVKGSAHNFLCELIEVIDRIPSSYVFHKCTSTKGTRISAQCRWVTKTIGSTSYKYLFLMLVDAKVTLMVEESRIDGLISYIADFIDGLT